GAAPGGPPGAPPGPPPGAPPAAPAGAAPAGGPSAVTAVAPTSSIWVAAIVVPLAVPKAVMWSPGLMSPIVPATAFVTTVDGDVTTFVVVPRVVVRVSVEPSMPAIVPPPPPRPAGPPNPPGPKPPGP